jgi:hypothetical protein
LPLPAATPANTLAETARIRMFERPVRNADYWGDRMRGLDFSRSDHADTARLNRVLWNGLKGEGMPYPSTRSGLDLRSNRKQLFAADFSTIRNVAEF